MTANLKLGRAEPAALVEAVRRHRVDVLMLQELTSEETSALDAAGLQALLPYHLASPRPGAQGTGLWSRFPLDDGELRPGFTFALVTARIAIPGSAVRPTVVALHMSGPYPQAKDWRHDIGQLAELLRDLPSDAPVIIGGDFNATPDVTQFRRLLRGGYADAADQAGAGYVPTYPANHMYPPLIAIDHVVTRDAVADSVRSVVIARSDHRALLVTVRVA